MKRKLDFSQISGFEWDEGNINKNWKKHHISTQEAEEPFLNKPFLIKYDEDHSIPTESRYQALGKTNTDRKIFLSFTIREGRVRVISARDQNRKERQNYEQIEEKT